MKKTIATLAVAATALSVLALTTTTRAGDVVKASLGAAAPTFTLENHEAKDINLEKYEGKIVVLEWVNPDCPFVRRHYKANTMENLAKKYADKDVVWVAVNSTRYFNVKKNAAFVKKEDLSYDVLDDHEGEVGHEYQATNTPHMFVLDAEGKLAYAGAIDDDPRGKKDEPTNYVANALDALIAGEKIETPETKPYGCSVKYQK